MLHTGAYWLMLKLRDAIPRPQPLALAARVIETASRVRIAFAAACPDGALFASLARCLQTADP